MICKLNADQFKSVFKYSWSTIRIAILISVKLQWVLQSIVHLCRAGHYSFFIVIPKVMIKLAKMSTILLYLMVYDHYLAFQKLRYNQDKIIPSSWDIFHTARNQPCYVITLSWKARYTERCDFLFTVSIMQCVAFSNLILESKSIQQCISCVCSMGDSLIIFDCWGRQLVQGFKLGNHSIHPHHLWSLLPTYDTHRLSPGTWDGEVLHCCVTTPLTGPWQRGALSLGHMLPSLWPSGSWPPQ